jgi:flagellar hook-associated protein 1 FlgK
LVGELGDTDLSTSLNNFFSSINEVLNQPESISVRNLAVLKGRTLVQDINHLGARAAQLRVDTNKRVTTLADDLNRLASEIRDLNIRISESEGGDVSNSDAVGLRDQRNLALSDLAKLVDIRVQEQLSGGVAVYIGGDYLVFEGEIREVEVQESSDRGLNISTVHLKQTDAALDSSSGELAGLYVSRDTILGGFLDDLDALATTLTFEFNKLYSSGQGLNGYKQVTSEFGVSNATVPLDEAGLQYTPVNGAFQIQVFNRRTGLTQSTDISIDLNGMDQDTSLNSLAAQLNAVSGVSASINSAGRLIINSTAADQELAFSNDTSGLLAALGINTFFTGTSAADLAINQDVAKDPGKFAASRGGIGANTTNAIDLASFIDRPLEAQNGGSLSVMYDRLTSAATQGSAVASSLAEGFRTFEEALRGQSLAVSGVSLDEEAIKMITLQRAFQASARYIATLSELLNILVNL